jgi:hypothetical protein
MFHRYVRVSLLTRDRRYPTLAFPHNVEAAPEVERAIASTSAYSGIRDETNPSRLRTSTSRCLDEYGSSFPRALL